MPATFEHIRELRQDRYKLIQEARAIYDEADKADREPTAEEETRFDALMGDADKLESRIRREERLLDAETQMEERREAKATAARQPEDRTEEPEEEREKRHSEAFRSYLIHGERDMPSEQRAALQEFRAQSVGTATAGGYTVPEGFWNQLEESLLAYGGMRETARVIQTASGNDLPIPTVDDTAQKGAILAENAQVAEQDVTFGQVTLNAYKYTSKLVRVSMELMQDSAFDMEAYLARALGERIARITNEHFTTGTGTAQPNGVVTASSAGVTGATGQTTSVTYDDLVDLEHSIDPAYRRGNSVRWMFADSTLKALKKLVDGNSNPIWLPGLAVREPDTILGYPYVINQDVADMAASAKSILFGDFSKYWIRDVLGVQVVRFGEKYMDYLQVGFLAFSRHDGELIDAGTDPIKHYANSAS